MTISEFVKCHTAGFISELLAYRKHIAYSRYVARHKYYVFTAALKVGAPLWIAILHDWDKFLPDEWFDYANTFYNADGSKKGYDPRSLARAWLKHQNRNKHHWQYWLYLVCDRSPSGINLFSGLRNSSLDEPHCECNHGVVCKHDTQVLIWDIGKAECLKCGLPFPDDRIVPNDIPDVFVREMIADWMGAGLATGNPDTAAWYTRNRDKIKLSDHSRRYVEELLRKHCGYIGG